MDIAARTIDGISRRHKAAGESVSRTIETGCGWKEVKTVMNARLSSRCPALRCWRASVALWSLLKIDMEFLASQTPRKPGQVTGKSGFETHCHVNNTRELRSIYFFVRYTGALAGYRQSGLPLVLPR